ncbi:efflux RND transporter periplasmic adaptor subunit [Robertkochia sediminum]|uniref:efflux RND transporter periplasmic adaptor subunit n=1 Tax=Robertkochia sediminum TaxID=2785326 RepID=UPI001933F63C|nr:efflux RND transporter periplasmic adaptor subunit [Robertkochia sediminum]MBL7473290.1 efflux RND transporter periplasmic adaptor subunit [Robertkochia sediminum]
MVELPAPISNEVSISILQSETFFKEIISNGKLEAAQRSSLRLEVGGVLEKLNVTNGSRVKKGEVMAVLADYTYRTEFTQASLALKKAKLEFDDMLVTRGYDPAHTGDIPKHLYEMAALRSGYQEALARTELAKYNLDHTVIRAPFSGIVANIDHKLHEQLDAGTVLLDLIDDREFMVTFSLLETEVYRVKPGNGILIDLMIGEAALPGKIVAVNPEVDDNGMVTVSARLENQGGLINGMNVKVRIRQGIEGQFVVPKEAVLLRQNQEVLFKFQSGKAYWTYVNTTNANSTSYSVIPNPDKSSATLEVGDTIIVSGNLNLAHDSKVVINNTITP